MNRARLTLGALVVLGLAAGFSPVRAAGGVDILSDDDGEHRMHAEQLAWPAGTIELVNHDARVSGWHHWFSECPNDVYQYGFRCISPKEINRLIALLAKIDSGQPAVRLSPLRDGPTLTLYPNQPQYNVAFAVGSQKRLDEWFERLPFEDESRRRRKWGVHRYTEPPTAMPPTLTIYIGRSGITLNDLEIPQRIDVAAEISKQRRQAPENPALIREIDEYAIARLKQRVDRLEQELSETRKAIQQAEEAMASTSPVTQPAPKE